MGESSPRPLSEGESALVRKAFGDRIDLSRVRICHGSGGNPIAAVALRNNDAIALIRTIFYRGDPLADFSTTPRKHLLMHEMTHVWQYQTLGVPRFYLRYGREFAARKFNQKAMYAYAAGDPFGKAMLEAQADMVCDYGRNAEGRAKAEASLAGTGLYGLVDGPNPPV